MGIFYKNMFDYLSLGKKYEVKAVDEFCSLNNIILASSKLPKESRKQFFNDMFERQISSFENEYGLNHWRTALYKAFRNNIDFF